MSWWRRSGERSDAERRQSEGDADEARVHMLAGTEELSRILERLERVAERLEGVVDGPDTGTR